MTDPKKSKPEYKANLAAAVDCSRENPKEKRVTAARIYKVNVESIRAALRRNPEGIPTQNRGQNKLRTTVQEEVIHDFSKAQWEGGLGATRQRVFSATGYLKEQENRKPPSQRWCRTWMKANPGLHVITTKPIARNRVERQSEKDLKL